MGGSALDYLKGLPKGPERAPFLSYLNSLSETEKAASQILALLNLEDSYVAPENKFYESPSSNLFEEWEYSVNARSIHEVNKGRLLCLPPGSDRFSQYRDIAPAIVEDQLETNFPRLKSELANRPNLFFQGVFYPSEISIESMEMISLHHGRNYVVKCDLRLDGIENKRTVVLKPTSMGVESGITSLIDELNRRMSPDLRGRIGPIHAPAIVSVDEKYGILEYLPGRNGVEILPRGINTGSIHALRSNEFPSEFNLSSNGLIHLADEFSKQAALAYYLRIYDRKPDQLMFKKDGTDEFDIAHIDFGRALKKNFALPWKRYYATQRAPLVFEDYQIPYFESAASLIFLPHFIPTDLAHEYPPFSGKLRRRIKRTFVELSHFLKRNAGTIREHMEALVGQKTQFNESEVDSIKVTNDDVAEINESLRSFDPSPEDVCESVINLAATERSGGAPTENPGGPSEDTIYGRGVRSGKASRQLVDRNDGENPYHLKNYRNGGKVYYDSENQLLKVDFGPNPQTIIDYVYWQYAPRLAEFFEEFADIKPETEAIVQLNGNSRITIPPGLVRTDVKFPREALDEVRQVARGFAAPDHLKNYLSTYNQWTENNPRVSHTEREIHRQKIIFEANMDGKEILQWYAGTTDEDSPVGAAIDEVIHHLLSDSDYLFDKDPLKSINNLVVNLGHKHEFIRPLTGEDFTFDDTLDDLFQQVKTIYNDDLPVGFFPDKTSQHLSHIKNMLGFCEGMIDHFNLTHRQATLLQAVALLHNIGVTQESFACLLMNPNNRLDRPIYRRTLKNHPTISREVLDSLIDEGRLSLPECLDHNRLIHLLEEHHHFWLDDFNPPDKNDVILYEILHIADNLAVFADHTRPGDWAKGSVKLSDKGPRWLETQYEGDVLSERVYRGILELFEENSDTFELNDRESRRFIQLHNALHLASLLEEGLNPQNPHMLRELRRRHGDRLIDQLWSQIVESNLPVAEKVRIIRRLDGLAPLFSDRGNHFNYVFLNASPRPVQRTVDEIRHHLNNGRRVILTGLFPRVTQAFERFRDTVENKNRNALDKVLAVAGKRRLQFIRHSYPYEAEFEEPFHRIIENHRRETDPDTSLCFIPFIKFYQGFSPVDDPASRVRELEKASAVEDHTPPEQVRSEADRFNDWRDNLHFDSLENERFRRILLNDFTNREILYFYQETLKEFPETSKAMEETIGALRENPNYLSERTSRYSIHELVRSLSQIHFFNGGQSFARDRLHEELDRIGIDNRSAYVRILDDLGSELNFFKNTFGFAIDHLNALKGEDNPDGAELYLVLAGSLIATNDQWKDYLLSPEDISYNRILREQLLTDETNLTEQILASDRLKQLPKSIYRNVEDILEGQRDRSFGMIQTALHLAFCVDFSRVENWERGHRRIHRRDIEQFLKPLNEILNRMLGRDTVEQVTAKTNNSMLLQSLRNHARQTYSYVYLYNALTFTAKLRYGLFPGAINSLDNVRELYGTKRVNWLISGIIESDLSSLESLKVARKIRYFASALNRMDAKPDNLYILNLDRSGTWSLPNRDETGESWFILSGELNNALDSWKVMKETTPDIAQNSYCLVGEEYPLLIKETTLSRTNDLRETTRTYRRDHATSGQYIFAPAIDILNELNLQQPDKEVQKPDDRHAVFLKSFLRIFQSEK